jgi:hypothetical protein
MRSYILVLFGSLEAKQYIVLVECRLKLIIIMSHTVAIQLYLEHLVSNRFSTLQFRTR